MIDIDRLLNRRLSRRALVLTAQASRERVAPIVFRPPRRRLPRTRGVGAEDGRKRIGDRTRRAASTQVGRARSKTSKKYDSRMHKNFLLVAAILGFLGV